MNIPELHGRDALEHFTQQLSRDLERPVLLLPTDLQTLEIPEAMPTGVTVKDRVGRLLTPKLTAFSPLAFDAAALHALGTSQKGRIRGQVGVHTFGYSAGIETDLMAQYPDTVRGKGRLLIVDGLGWTALDGDQQYPVPMYEQVGRATLLGVATITRDHIAGNIRRESEPSMAHYKDIPPIG